MARWIMSQSDAVQRLQIRFAAEGPLKYVSHLDLMRVWERVCKRAGLPLATSHGFSPRPKIALAAPLAVGATSEAELLDLLLTARVDLSETMNKLSQELTPGLRILELQESPLQAIVAAVDAAGGRLRSRSAGLPFAGRVATRDRCIARPRRDSLESAARQPSSSPTIYGR